jgi:hypothetical protein
MWGFLCESYRQSLLKILEGGGLIYIIWPPCERVPLYNAPAVIALPMSQVAD